MKNILFVVGSLRDASASRATARALQARLPAGITSHTANIGTLPHYNADLVDIDAVADWMTQVEKADGVIFVTPEYNYSIPGVLKNAIDWASRPAFESVFKGKPCFIVTVSGGGLGGVRAQAHLKYVLNAMLAEVFSCKEILVTFANGKIEDGVLTDALIIDFATENMNNFLAGL